MTEDQHATLNKLRNDTYKAIEKQMRKMGVSRDDNYAKGYKKGYHNYITPEIWTDLNAKLLYIAGGPGAEWRGDIDHGDRHGIAMSWLEGVLHERVDEDYTDAEGHAYANEGVREYLTIPPTDPEAQPEGVTEDQHPTQPEGVTETPAGWLARKLNETAVGGRWEEAPQTPAWVEWSDDEQPLGVASLDLGHLVGQWDIDRFKRFVADLYAVHGYRNMRFVLHYRGNGGPVAIFFAFVPSFTLEAFESLDSLEPHDPMWSINYLHMGKKADGKSEE